MSSQNSFDGKKLLEKLNKIEEAISGKPAKWVTDERYSGTSLGALFISIFISIWYTFSELEALSDSVDKKGKLYLYLVIFAISTFLLFWVVLLSIFKGTITNSPVSAILGLIAAGSIYFICNWLFGFVLIEANWAIVLSSRVQLFSGHEMNRMMVVDGFENQMWRLWISLLLVNIVACAAYGTSDMPNWKFITFYLIISISVILFTWYPEYQNFDSEGPITRFIGVTLIGLSSFSLTRWYSLKSQEFQINRLRRVLAILGILTFFISLSVMDPPDTFVERGWMEEGIKPALWGGLFVNLVLATAGGVLGLGIGVILAFGRQSKLPIFKWPSTLLIEVVRAGPMVAWLYFAKYLLQDVIVPYSDADAIMRTLMMFAFFGGVYTAEILRGGIQSIRSGQIEAATALGLNPNQIKMTVILPNSVRTTLPSLVSLLIGLWKDTTLIFIIGIFDFFKIAKDLNTSDLEFALDILEPLYMAAFVFWIIAFYLSRISLGIEKKLGLRSSTGGEMT